MTTLILLAGSTGITPEMMKIAGLNTLLGMGMAFFVLTLIMFVIMLFPIAFGERKPKKDARAELTEKSIDNTISQIEENEAREDDSELVAVIAAAIAAFEGTSAEGLVVRSIKRRGSRKQWQRA